MHLISLDNETDFDGWRKAARALVLNDVTPLEVSWTVRDRARDLPSEAALPLPDAPEGDLQRPGQIRRACAQPRSCIATRNVSRCSIACSGG